MVTATATPVALSSLLSVLPVTAPDSTHLTPSKIPVGARFDRLLVLGAPTAQQKVLTSGAVQRTYHYPVACQCGRLLSVRGDHLLSGQESCGCLHAEQTAVRMRVKMTTHGDSGSRLHHEWTTMHQRAKRTDKYYGHVVVDPVWDSYEAFRDWSLSHGYAPDLTLDRVDGTQGYSPANCRWATRREQQNNRRDNIRLTGWGETHTLSEWAADLRCAASRSVIESRYYARLRGKGRWATASDIDILTTPHLQKAN